MLCLSRIPAVRLLVLLSSSHDGWQNKQVNVELILRKFSSACVDSALAFIPSEVRGSSHSLNSYVGILDFKSLQVKFILRNFIIECVPLEATFRGHLVQSPCSEKRHLQLGQVVHTPIQSGLEYFHG